MEIFVRFFNKRYKGGFLLKTKDVTGFSIYI